MKKKEDILKIYLFLGHTFLCYYNE